MYSDPPDPYGGTNSAFARTAHTSAEGSTAWVVVVSRVRARVECAQSVVGHQRRPGAAPTTTPQGAFYTSVATDWGAPLGGVTFVVGVTA